MVQTFELSAAKVSSMERDRLSSCAVAWWTFAKPSRISWTWEREN